LQPGLPGLFERAHRLGVSTSLDPNYDPTGEWSGFDELLSLTDVFFPNGTEACSLARQADPRLAADVLSLKVKTLTVKLGPEGALAVQDGEMVQAASIPVKFVESVGAGDSFDAGFIYGYLHQWPLEKTLRLAAICGALSTQAAGGTIGQADWNDLQKYGLGK
ncbi:MAG: PfkB family carbohydrate kinase, partial [Chloroflexota bacterium]